MAKTELIEEVGWKLILEGRAPENTVRCFCCGENTEKEGFYCEERNRMVCRDCNNMPWKCLSTGRDEHEHLNIIEVKWEKK